MYILFYCVYNVFQLRLTDHFVDVMFLCFVGDYWVCLQITGGRGQAKEAFCSCKWNESAL